MNNLSIEGVKKFILDGSYARLKHEEEKLKLLRSLIRDEQDRLNNKRMFWREHGVIGEFVTNKLYEYDRLELNEILYDLGILPLISLIDSNLLSTEELQIIKPFQIPGEKYIRFSPNKYGKINASNQAALFEKINEISLSNKVALWKKTYLDVDFYKKVWERRRRLAVESCGSVSSVSFELGTISILASPIRLKADKVFDLLNKDTLLTTAKVDLKRLIEFTARGILKRSEVNKVRKVTDIQRKYMLITMQKEQNKRLYWSYKLAELSKLSL